MTEPLLAVLFLAGPAVFFLVGMGTFVLNRDMGQPGPGQDPRRRLAEVAANRTAWRVVLAVFFISFTATALATALVAMRLEAAGSAVLAPAAGVLYVLATAALFVHLTLVVGGDLAAAAEWARSSEVPGWWDADYARYGALFAFFMVGMFSAIALLGAAALEGSLLPRWFGWSSVAFGVLLGVSWTTKVPSFRGFNPADLPLWAHVWAVTCAVALLSGAA